MFKNPLSLQQKYGRQRKLNYTSMPSALFSIHFGDNQVVWFEANYYYSWHLAKKVIFNCIIQPKNSWIKITRKITFMGLAVP